jgi:type II secretory pathway pseudopilin PulG
MPDRCNGERQARQRPRGLMLLALLLMLAFGSIAALAVTEAWSVTRQREKEVELLFVGDQYLQAIRRYYYAPPRGQARVLPARLEDLVEDNRFPQPLHHLRRLYPDPITGSTEWHLVMLGERVAGVSSQSHEAPRKQTGFDKAHAGFEGKSSYEDWAFVFVPPRSEKR